MKEKMRIAVIGAGPAGAFCSMGLDKSKFDITIFDKREFPREKTCGDAISIEGIKAIKEFDVEIYEKIFDNNEGFAAKYLSVLDDKKELTSVAFQQLNDKNLPVISKRYYFDNILYERLKEEPYKVAFENKAIQLIQDIPQGVKLTFEDNTYQTFDIVVFATGSPALPNKFVCKKIETHNFFGIRQYVQNTSFKSHAMLFCLKTNHLPVYCWIFPLHDSMFNIGIYFDKESEPGFNGSILSLFKEVPSLKEFANNAVELSKPTAYHIPYNTSVSLNLVGEKYMVVGTAAGLIDPLTGEGISHAIKSGIIASNILNEVKDFITPVLQKEYINRINEKIMNKSKQSRIIQKLFSNKAFARLILACIEHITVFRWLFNNTYRIRTFFNRLYS